MNSSQLWHAIIVINVPALQVSPLPALSDNAALLVGMSNTNERPSCGRGGISVSLRLKAMWCGDLTGGDDGPFPHGRPGRARERY